MGDNDSKKYYYWKMDTDHFNKANITLMLALKKEKKVKGSVDGYFCNYVYERFMCEACVHRGLLGYDGDVPYTLDELKVVFHIPNDRYEDFDNACAYLIKKKFIVIKDDGMIYVPYAASRTGSETGQTKRKNEAKNKGENGNDEEVNNTNNGGKNYRDEVENLPQGSGKNTQELEIELEKELKKDIRTTTTDSCGGIWERLSIQEHERLKAIFENPFELVLRVDQEVMDKGEFIEKPFNYILGYAKNVNWARKDGMEQW